MIEDVKLNMKKLEKTLKGLKKFSARIKQIDIEIAELKDLKEVSLRGINYSKLVQTNSMFSKTEFDAIRSLEIEDTIVVLEFQKRRIERFLEKLDNALETLDETERRIIQMKLFEKKMWKSITFEVNLEERQCYEIKKRALIKLLNIVKIDDLVI